jgi:hypothetical protein
MQKYPGSSLQWAQNLILQELEETAEAAIR